jgi:hypothetical protein
MLKTYIHHITSYSKQICFSPFPWETLRLKKLRRLYLITLLDSNRVRIWVCFYLMPILALFILVLSLQPMCVYIFMHTHTYIYYVYLLEPIHSFPFTHSKILCPPCYMLKFFLSICPDATGQHQFMKPFLTPQPHISPISSQSHALDLYVF